MRLINADKLSEELKDLDLWCKDLRKPGIEQARCIVHEQPTIYAAPVVHARWLEDSGPMKCSNCGLSSDIYYECDANYCPQCGAKMDLEDAE